MCSVYNNNKSFYRCSAVRRASVLYWGTGCQSLGWEPRGGPTEQTDPGGEEIFGIEVPEPETPTPQSNHTSVSLMRAGVVSQHTVISARHTKHTRHCS